MLLDIGFALSPDATAAESFGIKSRRAFISPEKLDVFAADTMVLLRSASVEGELDAVDKIKTNPLWAKLPAVQANRVYALDRIGYPGFRGAKQLLADVVKAIEK
jgi:ABC-type Fe3+-hydroxamate transport system substrate-binding protein